MHWFLYKRSQLQRSSSCCYSLCHLLYMFERAIFAATVLSGVGYGTVIIISIMCAHLLLLNIRSSTAHAGKTRTICMLIYVGSMFALNTGYLATSSIMSYAALANPGLSFAGLGLASSAFLTLTIWGADGLLV